MSRSPPPIDGGSRVVGRRNSKCKGPEIGPCVVYWRNSTAARLAMQAMAGRLDFIQLQGQRPCHFAAT